MRKKKKVIFIVIDGMADLPIGGKTPLSEAYTPNLDSLARNGLTGEILPLEKKYWSELRRASVSHLAVLSLFGYTPGRYYLRRGPLEVVGSDVPYTQGHLALRCNFVTVDEEMRVIDRRVGRNSFGLDELSRSINLHVKIGEKFVFKRTYEHRAFLLIQANLSDKITDSDPYSNWEKVKKVEPLTKEAERSAKLVQTFLDKAKEIIEYDPANEKRIKKGLSPANCIVTREAGNKLPRIKSFLKKHKIEKGVCIAENGCVKGIGLLIGLDGITVPEMKFEPTLRFIFNTIKDSLVENDLVFAHIKGPDEPAHDGDFYKKSMFLEKIDTFFEKLLDFEGILIVTCDHITSCKTKKHEFGYVPLLIHGKGKDRIRSFNEMSVKKGKLKKFNGKKLWRFVLKK